MATWQCSEILLANKHTLQPQEDIPDSDEDLEPAGPEGDEGGQEDDQEDGNDEGNGESNDDDTNECILAATNKVDMITEAGFATL
jgi:hypothetical protein